jgi:hypothetical protein
MKKGQMLSHLPFLFCASGGARPYFLPVRQPSA